MSILSKSVSFLHSHDSVVNKQILEILLSRTMGNGSCWGKVSIPSKISIKLLRNSRTFCSFLEKNTHFLDEAYDNVSVLTRYHYVSADVDHVVHCVNCDKIIRMKSRRGLSTYKERGHSYCSNVCMQGSDKHKHTLKDSCFAKTGFHNWSQVPEVKEAKKDKNPFSDPNIMSRIQDERELRTGFRHAAQNPEVQFRMNKSGKHLKVIGLNNKTFYLQGYEPQALLYMTHEKGLHVADILQHKDFEYEFTYSLDGKKKHYHPDFLVKSLNRIIEVKSTWTLCGKPQDWKVLCLKRKSVLKAGYNFSLLLMSPDGNRFQFKDELFSYTYKQLKRVIRSLPYHRQEF